MQDGIFYKHYRTAYGAMTFAIEREQRPAPRPITLYRVGCAFCSPPDLGRFSRTRGRQIARSRLRSAPIERGIILERAGGGPAFYEVMDIVIDGLDALREQYDQEERAGRRWRDEPGAPRWFPAFAVELREQRAAAVRARAVKA
ncbi:MAG: hypothetical protein WC683_01385 [bacterium]